MFRVRRSTVIMFLCTPLGIYVAAIVAAAVLSLKPNYYNMRVAVRQVSDGGTLVSQLAVQYRGFYHLSSTKLPGSVSVVRRTDSNWAESDSRRAQGSPVPTISDEYVHRFLFPSVLPLVSATVRGRHPIPPRRVGLLDLSTLLGPRSLNHGWVPVAPVISNILIAWLPVAAGLLGIRFVYERSCRKRAGARGVCVACGYALGALHKCPECGRARLIPSPRGQDVP